MRCFNARLCVCVCLCMQPYSTMRPDRRVNTKRKKTKQALFRCVTLNFALKPYADRGRGLLKMRNSKIKKRATEEEKKYKAMSLCRTTHVV